MRSVVSSRILIVDDDLRLRELLQRYLSDQGFEVRGVGSAAQMERVLAREHVDLLVLDLMLPDEDGLSICSRLRAGGNDLPILMLTAKGDDVDRIIGLEIGADDYLPKPCNPRELVARIKAVLRRREPRRSGEPQADGQRLRFGEFELDLATRRLSRDGELVNLTTAEFGLLSLFVKHPHETLSRDRLLSLSHGRQREHGAYDRSIDVLVSRLRKLLETDPGNPRYIQTVWGAGYVFVPDGEVS